MKVNVSRIKTRKEKEKTKKWGGGNKKRTLL